MSSRSGREKHLLTVTIFGLPEQHAALPRTGRTLQLIVTNLRNRPLRDTSLDSMRDTIMSLYNNLITGSRDFPLIPYRGAFRRRQAFTPFAEQEQRENTWQPFLDRAPGMMGTRARPLPPIIRTPVLPERVELGVLLRDSRNRVQRLEVNGRRVSRVISLVFGTNFTQVPNRWRVSDYAEDGQCLMSVLCRFVAWSLRSVPKSRKRRRDNTEEEDSSQSRPKKRLRL